MDITEKNGHPSMEEILASIRRIIAEEPATPPAGIEIKAKTASSQGDSGLDEHGDFDLPAIFRTTQAQAPEKSAPLFGRLTDALRGASSEAKAARIDEPISDYNEPAEHRRNGASHSPYPALSTLKAGRQEPHLPEPRPVEAPPAETAKSPAPAAQPSASAAGSPAHTTGWKFGRAPAPSPAVEDEIKRVMAPFKDTRFKQMAGAEQGDAPAAPVPEAPAQPTVRTDEYGRQVDFGAIVPARMDVTGAAAGEQNRWADNNRPAPHYNSSPLPPEQHHYAAEPNHLAQGYADPAYARAAGVHDEQVAAFRQSPPPDGAPTGTIEDTTAELLRPMLRQWLADNMPRMVEKALHIEVAESVRTVRKGE